MAAKLLALTSDESGGDAAKIGELVAGDPAIAARVLQVARRAEAAGRDIDTLQQAVVRLGNRGVRDSVLAVGVAKVLDRDGVDDDGAFGAAGGFWRHSVAVACCSEFLAQRLKDVPTGDAFCCGLLHDLGKLALHSTLPKAYDRIVRAARTMRCDIAEVERQVVGIDHHIAGARLAKRWNLPPTVCDAIALHHARPEPGDPPERRMVYLIHLADQITRQLHLGFSGNYTFGTPQDALLRALGLKPADASAAIRVLVQLTQERASALGLDDASADAMYRDGIASANDIWRSAHDDVARLRREAIENAQNAELNEDRERELAARADAFASMSSLSDELAADATPRDVMLGIAETAGTALKLGPDAAVLVAGYFRDHEEADVAEFVLCTPTGGLIRGDCVTGGPEDGGAPKWTAGVLGGEVSGIVATGGSLETGFVAWTGQADATGSETLGSLRVGWNLAMNLAGAREKSRLLEQRLAEEARQAKAAREQIAHDRALVAVAELAAGAAHEMNNPLMVISGRSQLLYNNLHEVRMKQAALAIHHNAGRMSEMIEELMRYARPPEAEVEKVKVRKVVDEAIKLVGATLDEDDRKAINEMNIDVPDSLPLVGVDVRRWARAISATVENAAQSLPSGGGAIDVSARPNLTGDGVVLTIRDNGCGMDEATLQRACDPFFSKRPAGRGRGMGLAAALRLVETGGGTLSLDSRQGEGTRAVFTLPVAMPAQRRKSA
ncbi:MAG: HDOD domain-containing protein [Planctomycetota bacterium]